MMGMDITANFTLVHRLYIPEYITKVKISEKRRPQYYSNHKKRGCKTTIPKKYSEYKFNKDGILIDLDGKPLIANPLAAGTPKYQTINGQVFYSQKGGEFTRAKVVTELHKWFAPFVATLPVFEEFPIVLHLEWSAPYSYQTMDNTNMSFAFYKVFEDEMVKQGKIPDDEVAFISGGFPLYTPCNTFEERSLIFSFYKDGRECMKNIIKPIN